MAVLEVLMWPHPFLREKAESVEVFDDALRALIADMEDTMAARDGIGLAATQVGVARRILVLDPYALHGEEGRGRPNTAVVNPTVEWQSEETEVAEEGCLSFPGIYIPVERPLRVRVRALDGHGQPLQIITEQLGSRALLHEIDHLEGQVMTDLVSHLVRTRALKKHGRNQAAAEKDAEADTPRKKQKLGRRGLFGRGAS